MNIERQIIFSALNLKHYRFFSRKTDGYTLIELLITVAIAGILLTVGIPGFNSLIKESRQTTLRNEFNTYYFYARNEAVKRRTPITLCPQNADGTNCDSSKPWGDGWIIFVDSNNDGDKDSGELILKAHEAIHRDINIVASSTAIRVNERGFNLATSIFTFCDSRGSNFTQTKYITKAGRIQVSDTHQTCT